MRNGALISILSAGFFAGSMGVAQPPQTENQPPRKMNVQRDVATVAWMKCVAPLSATSLANVAPTPTPSQPSAANVSGAGAPTNRQNGVALRIVFALEPNNGDEISADTYAIDAHGKNIKQIGHAELLSRPSANGVLLQSSQDSPFQLSLFVEQPQTPQPNVAMTQGPTQRTLTGALSSLALFAGATLSQIPVQCRIYGNHNSLDSSRPPAAQPSPTATPSE